MQFLKQSTAATVKVGPFVDSTDGVTPETGLTIAQADIRLAKGSSDFASSNNAAGALHDENGYYGIPLNTTDTNTCGRLNLAIYVSGALPCRREFMVLAANVYDSIIGGTDYLQVDLLQIAGSATPATNLGKSALAIVSGAAAAGTLSVTAMTTDLTEVTNDHYHDRTVQWTSGVLLGQWATVTDYDGATKKLTFTAVTDAPSAGDTFVLL